MEQDSPDQGTGRERRTQPRNALTRRAVLIAASQTAYAAAVTDFSQSGLGLSLEGNCEVQVSDSVVVRYRKRDLHGKVVRVRNEGPRRLVGIHLAEDVDADFFAYGAPGFDDP